MVSCISILFPLFTFIVFSVKRRSMERFSFLSCISCFGLNLTIFVGTTGERFCTLQAVGTQYFNSSLLFWWLCICYFFHQVIVKEIPILDLHYLDKFFHIIGWGLPIPITLISFSLETLANERQNDSWECWIKKTDLSTQVPVLDGLLALCLFLSLLLWPQSAWRLYCLAQTRDRGVHFPEYMRQTIFVMCFFLRFLLILIFHLIDISYSPAEPLVYVLALIYTIAVAATGIYSFLIYGVSWEIIALWSQRFSACPCASATVDERINNSGGSLDLLEESSGGYYVNDNDYGSSDVPLVSSFSDKKMANNVGSSSYGTSEYGSSFSLSKYLHADTNNPENPR